MANFDYKQLCTDAKATVAGFGRTAIKLIAIHAGVTIGANLILSILNYSLDMGIAQTGGLSDIATVTLLETIQQFMQTIVTIALPFWEMGYVFTALQMARKQSADSVQLLTGFRYFGAILRVNLLRFVIYFALVMVGAQIASYVFMLTPAASQMMLVWEEMLATLESGEMLNYAALLENEAYMQAMMPAIPYMLVGALLPLIPALYRMRMMDFALMDEPRRGALYAFGKSLRMTRKRCLTIFKLDLHFWWYYLLQLLAVALCYGDVLLPMLGIQLDMNGDVAMFLFYAIAMVAELGLYIWKKNQVTVSYAMLYDAFAEPVVSPPKPAPTHVPWNYET